MKRTCFAIMIACIVAVSGASAQEAGVWHYRVDGQGVTAYFQSVDTSTCELGIETIADVQAAQGVVYTNNEPTASSVATVVVEVFDRCLDMSVLSVSGSGPADQLDVNPNTKSASLRTSIQGTDLPGNPVTITVDLAWIGANQAEHTNDHTDIRNPIHKWISTSTGVIRDAVAAGSVVVGTLDATPLPSTQGVIEKNSSRTVDIWR